MNRKVSCNTPILPDPKMIEWLTTNGIDPFKVPADQEIPVTEEHIEFTEFLTDEAGNLQIAYRDGDPYRPKQTRTVPLLSDPENHGVEVYNV